MTNNFTTTGFSSKDRKRIKLFLKKLFPYINLNKCSIVGGLAIRYHLAVSNIPYPTRPLNDIDLMVEEASVVSSLVSKDFYVYHYHPPQNGSFYIVLVDPILKIKVDIFDYSPPLEDPIEVKFNGYKIKIRNVEDQLVKTVFDIQRISKDWPVDPKQFQDTRFLMKIADLKKADKIWQKRNYKNYPKTLLTAINRAEEIAQKHPEWLKEGPVKKPQPYKCQNCKSTARFKVTPMEQVYKILGYVE